MIDRIQEIQEHYDSSVYSPYCAPFVKDIGYLLEHVETLEQQIEIFHIDLDGMVSEIRTSLNNFVGKPKRYDKNTNA